MRVSLANAKHTFDHADAVFFLNLGTIPDDWLEIVSNCLSLHLPWYTLNHCPVGTQQHDEWILKQTSGVHLVILHGVDQMGDDIEHSVVVDAEAQLVIDLCDLTPLQMTWFALQQFVGTDTYRAVIGVRKVHRHAK